MNTIHGNGADGTSLIMSSQIGAGLNFPEELDKCASSPQQFLELIDKWKILNLEDTSFDEAYLNLQIFTQIAPTSMFCLLRFSDDFIEIARIKWSLQNLFTALELRLNFCIKD